MLSSNKALSSTNNEHIYILAVNFNGSKDTIKLLKSIEHAEQKGVVIEIIIIDNASEKHELTTIKTFIADLECVTLLESKDNIGYFPAFNIGLEYIKHKLPATVLLCNNDLVFEKDFFTNYLKNKYDDDAFVIAPNVITLDGRHQNPHLISKISTFRKFLYDIYFSNYYVAKLLNAISGFFASFRKLNKNNLSHKSGYIYMGIGACYILRTTFFNYYMKVDDRVFLGGEEALLAGQLQKVGGRTYYDSSLKVRHAEGVSFSKMPSRWRYNASKKSYSIYKQYL